MIVDVKDLIVVLPGIMGSVLEKNGRVIWNISGKSFLKSITSSEDLILQSDDHDDGVVATKIMEDFHIVPGIIKILDGYTKLQEQLLDGSLRLYPQSPNNQDLVNYYEFPYDWRRDNRISAQKLKQFIDERLENWRRQSEHKDAQVIILAHSMGGLVSRYYLEVLEGWRDCRALITFGTPYRGSVKAISAIVEGYNVAVFNFSEAVRSFTSVYQLLPIYEMFKTNGGYRRISEVDGIPNLDRERAVKAREFHQEIINNAEKNRRHDDWKTNGYVVLPFVGTRQSTYQSASLIDGQLQMSYNPPSSLPPELADGDDTVPRISAIPVEMEYQDYYNTFFPCHHGEIQANKNVLDLLKERIGQMQSQIDLSGFKGAERSAKAEAQIAFNLSVKDLYLSANPIEIYGQIINAEPSVTQLIAQIIPKTTQGEPITVELQPDGDYWKATVENLAAGVYEVQLSTPEIEVTPVRDLFEVA
ncbi:MAG: lecithin--cholesterol acyltransferase [Okeania sp. SIO1H6]|nr:lecithin--cholesterol acyltransferase [Okeania sp. SIO1H6]